MDRTLVWVLVTVMVCMFSGTPSAAESIETEPSLLSFSFGSLLIHKPSEYNRKWSAFWILDERPDSGWASAEGAVEDNVFVIELAEKTVLKRLEFDTAQVDTDGSGARDVVVEISNDGPSSGFQEIATLSLADRQDGQSFPVKAEIPGRWVRLTIRNNHGSAKYTELMDLRGYGQQLTTTSLPDVSGTYTTNYKDFHLRQQGTSVTGCYEWDEGVLNGGIEGRIMKFTWREKDGQGPAIVVFASDGKKFFGLWWYEGKTNTTGGVWNGELKTQVVGGCPHWAGGAEEQLAKELAQCGRTRVYGINFDVDSAVIREESKPTMDKIVTLLKADAAMNLVIEGHTDSSGTAEHNVVLSQQRAESVKSYLVAAGISSERLSARGYGASRPVSSNSTATGKAQNRRVELVRK